MYLHLGDPGSIPATRRFITRGGSGLDVLLRPGYPRAGSCWARRSNKAERSILLSLRHDILILSAEFVAVFEYISDDSREPSYVVYIISHVIYCYYRAGCDEEAWSNAVDIACRPCLRRLRPACGVTSVCDGDPKIG